MGCLFYDIIYDILLLIYNDIRGIQGFYSNKWSVLRREDNKCVFLSPATIRDQKLQWAITSGSSILISNIFIILIYYINPNHETKN